MMTPTNNNVTHLRRHRHKHHHQETAQLMQDLKDRFRDAERSNYEIVGDIEHALVKDGWKVTALHDRIPAGTALVDYGKRRLASNIPDVALYQRLLARVTDILSNPTPVAPAQYRYVWVMGEAFVCPDNTLTFKTDLNIEVLTTADELRSALLGDD